MFVSIRNTKDFASESFYAISDYLMTDKFKRQLAVDQAENADETTRFIFEPLRGFYFVRSSDFSPPVELSELYLSSVERYGLIDMLQIGTDANKTSCLYWIAVPRAQFVTSTSFGLICRNADSKDTAKPIARFDHLYLVGNKTSTVLAIERGSSHMQT